jgi:ATP-dependent RNA helicase DDX19/DBP5
MESTNKNQNSKSDGVDQINLDIDKKLIINNGTDNQDDKSVDQFENIAEKNKNLEDDLCEKPVAINVGDDGPENIVKNENELFDPNSTWESLGVPAKITEGLIEMGFVKPSKIQASTYPAVMRQPYSHLIAQSPNGSGKTGAFGIATLSRIDDKVQTIQAVVLAHTRELVIQIAGNLGKMAKYTNIQVMPLEKEKLPHKNEMGHVVVTTPGTFMNAFFDKKLYDLKNLKVLVLDEADYMISNDNTLNICEKTFKHFQKNCLMVQVLSFSATYTPENFATFKKHFKKAVMIQMKKESLTLKNVRQLYYKCNKRDEKVQFIEEYLKRSIENERVIIFVNTRDYTAKLQEILVSKGYKVYILMGGNMDPKERFETVEKFKKGEIQIMITTNLLSRGFDEKLVKLVINFDLPTRKEGDRNFVPDMETYLHRIGRTGRFGTKGIGLTLVSSDVELKQLKEIEEFYQSNIEEIKSLDDLLDDFKRLLEEKF